MKLRKVTLAFLAVICILATVFPCVLVSFAEDTRAVYARSESTLRQGDYAYLYVYIDDLTNLSALSVSVYYDASCVSVHDAYNAVPASVYDINTSDGEIHASYIFDGNGEAAETNLFYIYYQVKSDAALGNAYFDVIVTDAYDTSLKTVSVSSSRCNFTVAEKSETKNCYVSAQSSLSSSVLEEFELNYCLSTSSIASGSAVISYDPELFEFVGITNGDFLTGKLVDVNSSLSGSVYVSFLGTEYNYSTDLLNIRFRTLKNVSESSEIKLTFTSLYDLELNPISCNVFTSSVDVTFDETYTEDSPSVSLSASYVADGSKVTLSVSLEKDSLLGAGDFVLNFDPKYLTYVSSKKEFEATFFNVNDKNVGDGVLKFSIISLTDITDSATLLTVVFDAKQGCEDKLVDLSITGNGLTDSLTNPITLNFIDASVTLPTRHTGASAVVENKVDANCTEDGSYDSVVYCSVCKVELSREKKTIDKLGHNHKSEFTVDREPTCTEKGSKSRHCTRCDDMTEVTEIAEKGHTYGAWYEVKAPTCTETGIEERECSVCHAKENRSVDAKGHTKSPAVIENKVDANCTEDGSYDSVVYCSDCRAELSREKVKLDMLGHSFDKSVWGYRKEDGHAHVCTKCGANDTVEPHVSGGSATESSAEICTICKYVIAPMLGHTHSFTVKNVSEQTKKSDASCTQKALYYYSCACSAVSDDQTFEHGDLLDHRYGEWSTVKEPTESEFGLKTRKCVSCGDEQSEELPKLEVVETTTEKEDVTTKEPDVTETTTSDEVTTTQKPEDTTKAPEDTTKLPEDTTKIPEDTTKVPEDTTKSSVDTTTQTPTQSTPPDETTDGDKNGKSCGSFNIGTATLLIVSCLGLCVPVLKKKN